MLDENRTVCRSNGQFVRLPRRLDSLWGHRSFHAFFGISVINLAFAVGELVKFGNEFLEDRVELRLS